MSVGVIPTIDKCRLGAYLQKTNVGWGHTYKRQRDFLSITKPLSYSPYERALSFFGGK